MGQWAYTTNPFQILQSEFRIRKHRTLFGGGKAREKGRKLAQKAVRKIDPVFTPRKLNPDDAKVIFHPIDYIVFNGMKEAESIKNVILLDRQSEGIVHRTVQKSIERIVERENYEWQTLRVQEDGKIKVE